MIEDSVDSPFCFRGLWQWNPVSCVTPRGYDEAHMMQHDEWFWDHRLMRRYFSAMADAGLNTWILANTHPFPFMVDLAQYPDAVVLDGAELARYQAHYHWLFATAIEHGIQPFVMFHTCYVPDRLGVKQNIRPTHGFEPPPLAYDYTRYCVRQLCDTYPELAGINGEASENVAPALRARFAREAIVAGIHDSKQRPTLFFRGWIGDPVAMKENVLNAYEGECLFTVKYTWEFLIDSRPDPEFTRWLDVCGAEHILPEFWISNYQPFGCHDRLLARAIHKAVRERGCRGFTSHPMDMYGAPFVQGATDVLQVDRDHAWFSVLSAGAEGEDHRGHAASRPSQRISYFVTGNKQNFHQPQWLCAVGGNGDRRAGLFSFAHWAALREQTVNSFGCWPEQMDNLRVRYPNEEHNGWSLPELLAELRELTVAPEEPISPSNPVATAIHRDIAGQRTMAEAWIARGDAVIAHFASQPEVVLDALATSLECVRKMSGIVGFDGPYRLLVGRHTIIVCWSQLVTALEQELDDYRAGVVKDFYFFGTAEHHDRVGKDFADALN